VCPVKVAFDFLGPFWVDEIHTCMYKYIYSCVAGRSLGMQVYIINIRLDLYDGDIYFLSFCNCVVALGRELIVVIILRRNAFEIQLGPRNYASIIYNVLL